MSSEKKITRRTYLKYAAGAVAVAAVGGGAYYAGLGQAPPTTTPAMTTSAITTPITTTIPTNAGLTGKPIVIGGSLPLSGAGAYDGERGLQGFKIAVQKINEDGGVLGRPLKLVMRDDGGSEDRVSSVTETLITQDKADFLTGSYGAGSTYAALVVAKKYGKLMTGSLVAGRSCFTDFKGNIVSVHASADYESDWYIPFTDMMDAFSQWSTGGAKPKTIAIIHANIMWNHDVHDHWIPILEDRGYKIVMEDYLDMMTTDFRPALTKAKSLNPDIIVGGTWFFMSVLTMKQMVELGFYPPAIFLADGSDFSFVDPSAGVGPQGNGVFFTEPYPGSSIPELRGRDGDYLEEQYKLAMNRSADYFSGVCFSAVQVLAQAIEAAGTVDTDAVRQALFTKEFNTAIWSRTVFNEFGVQKYFKPLAAQWQDNKKEIVWPSDYATAKPIYPYVPVK